MRLLFVHVDFPGQYVHLARHLAAQPGNEVVALGERETIGNRPTLPGIKEIRYQAPILEVGKVTVDELNTITAVRRGAATAQCLQALVRSGFRPDVICAHSGWGEALFLKDVVPDARLLLYCEFFRRTRGGDLDFDPEFKKNDDPHFWVRVINGPCLSALEASDLGISPTRWQQQQFPAAYAPRIRVIHDGINTDKVAPKPGARFQVPGTTLSLSKEDEVVTYVSRNLEPYRGFHIFMRAIPEIQRRRPKARIVIVGGDGISYSPFLPPGRTYRELMLKELEGKLELSRLHFAQPLPYDDYLSLLQVSSAHVYLTYPFVLSWSLTEALSVGCLVIGSRTPPVEEVITDGENGLLVDFFSPDRLAAKVDEALRAGDAMQAIRKRARRTIVERYDLTRVCLPAQVRLIQQLAAGEQLSTI